MKKTKAEVATKELLPLLLEEIKHALAITWDEENREITRLAERSVYAINDVVGIEVDIETNLSAREMVIQRVRYDYNNALDEFETNYKRQLSRLILQVAIAERKKAENGTETVPEDVQ
ncbi:hypothetical protein P4278_07095 [Bacillus thuringiensis]|nr:hypothetical protein [Bacillus thuringiensis]MED2779500.1 hypothetical protein [Bacillus thuringiensis]